MTNLQPSQAAAELLRRRAIRSSLTDWCRHAGFEPAAHHRLLISKLEAVARGEIDRLAVFMPPGSAKSTYASVLFPPWFLAQNPQAAVIAASHTQELADHWGRRVRNVIAQETRTLGIELAPDSAAAGRWELSQGGAYFAAGVGGSITGRRADLAIIDDPVKSREDADSDRARNRVWDWYKSDLYTRLKPGARVVLIQTRWHEDDLAGRLLTSGDGWDVLSLPAVAERDDALGRPEGQALWPEWESGDELDRKRKMVGEREWLALYQQRPTADQGTYFRRDWFSETYTEKPSHLNVYISGDFAVTPGDGDFTELGVWGVDKAGTLYVLDWWHGQTSADIWVTALLALVQKWRPLFFVGETGPIRRAVEPLMERMMQERRIYCAMEWLSHSGGNKEALCRSFQAMAAQKRVRFPKDARWSERVLDQLLRFPSAKYDDAVDTCGLVGRFLDKMPAASDDGLLCQTVGVV
jgi:predicted phage terminase large subunit-like protein